MSRFRPFRFSLAALLVLLTVLGPVIWGVAYWWNTPRAIVIVRLDSQGTIFADGQPIAAHQLAEWLEQEWERREARGIDAELVVEASKNVPAGDVMQVVAASTEVRAMRVSVKAVEP